MDRNREARRSNGASLSRRRHRSSTTLRDSTDENGGVELQESIRLRERVKKERDLRERDRDRERFREREREKACKRRRAERLLIHHNTNNNHNNTNSQFNNNNHRSEDVGLVDDSSEESVNDDEDEEYEEIHQNHHHNLHLTNSTGGGGGGGARVLPPSGAAGGGISNQYHNNKNSFQPLQHRKSFPPSGNNSGSIKTLRSVPVWKTSDEMISVSVPRKARSAATKRSHDWNNGGGEQPLLTSPTRQSVVTASTPSPVPPVSPSSSNASTRKKLKVSNGAKPRPPKSSSVAKPTSSNPEELEFEIAEVLYGLMTQTQGPSSKTEVSSDDSKEASNRSNHDSKSRVSSPVSGSNTGPPVSILPQNAASSAAQFSSVAPKRKRPRQVADNLVSSSAKSSPISSTKVEIDQTLKPEIRIKSLASWIKPKSPPVTYKISSLALPEPTKMDSERKVLAGEVVDGKIVSIEKEEICSMKKDSPVLGQDGSICEDDSEPSATGARTGTCILVGSVNKGNLNMVEVENNREEKFRIDLMAPPPQSRMSPEKEGEVDLAIVDTKLNLLSVKMTSTTASEDKEAPKMEKSGKSEMVNDGGESNKAKIELEHVESTKSVENKSRSIDLQLHLERPGETIDAGKKLQKQGSQQQQQETVTKSTTKEEPHDEKPGLSNSLSVPLSMPSWPSGIRPMGYMAPLQGVVSMDGVAVPPAPIQMPMFTQPRPKRCATHCYIARNIYYMQQFMKMNPFWSAAATASSASLFGSKPCNLSVVPSGDLQLNTSARVVNHSQEHKGQGLATPLGHGGKEIGSQHLNSSDFVQRNQEILLQQAMPPVPPNNLLGPAFIFPLNQQQAAVAAAVRPGSAKSPVITPCAASSNAAANSSAVNSSAVPAMSYNYPHMSGNETQYLAILQNNAYPFPIPTVGVNPNYRGPHPQPMPFFNGFSYSSQMIHPSQLQQQAVPPSQSQQMQQSHPNALLSSSSATHKHLQSPQQTSQGNAVNGSNGNGNLQQLAAKKRSSQQSRSSSNQHHAVPQFRQLDSHVGGGDGPNTTDNRGTRAPVNMYGQNVAMPMNIPNFALITPPSASNNQGDKKHHQSQQPGIKNGIESLPPQTFAMSFGPVNGAINPGIDLSSMAQNHPIFQNFTDSSRHNFQMMAATTAGQGAHIKKDGRASEDSGKTGGGDPSDCADDERKSMSNKVSTTAGQSIAFSRSELPDGSVIQGSHVVESSSRSLNPTSASARGSHTSMPNHMVFSGAQNAQLQVQLQHQQQQLIQFHKQQQQQLTAQQQQQLTARSKTPVTSNGSAYPDHLSASMAAANFSNALSYPQNLLQSNNSNSPSQSPQWKNPPKTSATLNPSSFSSSGYATLKNKQQQQPTIAFQNLTQISFGGSNQKSTAASHRQPPASNQASSPPIVVGSPTTSSISKDASGSPRIAATSTTDNKTGPAPSMSTQQSRSSPSGKNQKSSPSTGSGRNAPSILGNPQAALTPGIETKSQMHAHQQQMAKNLQQAQLFFSNPYMQNQSLNATSVNALTSGNTGYYLQRRRPDQQHSPQQPPGSSAPTSTGMVSHSAVGTMDPAKAVVAAGASNMKGGGLPSQSVLNASQFMEQAPGNPNHLMSGGFSYCHTVPAVVQVKPAEQKQPAGNDSLHEKK